MHKAAWWWKPRQLRPSECPRPSSWIAAVSAFSTILCECEASPGSRSPGAAWGCAAPPRRRGLPNRACDSRSPAPAERREIEAVIPAKAEPIRSPVPLRRFRYDARHDILRCPRGKLLRPTRPVKHGRFFYSRPSTANAATSPRSAFPRGARTSWSSATTTPRSCAPAGAGNDGRTRIAAFTSATAGGRRWKRRCKSRPR